MEIKKVNFRNFDVFVGKGWYNWVRVEVNKDQFGNKKGHVKKFNDRTLTLEQAEKIVKMFILFKFNPENKHVQNKLN